MIRATFILLVTAGLVVLVIGVFISERRMTNASSSQREVSELRDELARLRNEQREMGRSVALALQSGRAPSPLSSSDGTQITRPASSGNESLDYEAESRNQQEFNEASKRVMADKIYREGTDPVWSSKAESAINEALAARALTAAKYTTECKQTLCKIEFKLGGDNTQYGRHMVSLIAPWNAPGFIEMDADGNGTYYIAREGFQLPSADRPKN